MPFAILSRSGGLTRAVLAIMLLAGIPAVTSAFQEPASAPMAARPMQYAIAIHGGAGSSPDMYPEEARQRRIQTLEEALTIGRDILRRGGTALEAVERVVIHLENDPQFNAGVGAVFNAAGSHELDACIMDGQALRCGAVAGVSRVRNPVSLARRVMEQTPHVLLAGTGAEDFAASLGIELVEPSVFDTPAARRAWERTRARQSGGLLDRRLRGSPEDIGSAIGTVGCVALDAQGNLAAATSTGGMSNKRFGRVGDSPIVGAGTWAENATAAISCTGVGEEFIRHAVASSIAARIRYTGCPLETAVSEMLSSTLQPNDGGIIAVDRSGAIAMEFNTRGMARAAADSTGRFEVLWETRESVPPDSPQP